MGADDKVRLAVLVDEPGGGLEPLELSVFGLESVGDQSGRARLEHCKVPRLKINTQSVLVVGSIGFVLRS